MDNQELIAVLYEDIAAKLNRMKYKSKIENNEITIFRPSDYSAMTFIVHDAALIRPALVWGAARNVCGVRISLANPNFFNELVGLLLKCGSSYDPCSSCKHYISDR